MPKIHPMVFDIIFLVILGWAAYRGFKKGLIVQVASLFALILGIYGTIKFSYITTAFLQGKLGWDSAYIHIISFILTFILIVIGVHFVGKLVDKLAQAVALGFVIRITGSVFNVLKFGLIISVILVILNSFNSKYSFLPADEIQKSKMYKPLMFFAPTVFPKINLDINNQFKKANGDNIYT